MKWLPYAVAALLLLGTHSWMYQRGVTTTETRWQLAQAEAAQKATDNERQKEQQHQRAMEALQADSTQRLEQLRLTAGSANAELGRLHQRLADLQAGADRQDSSAAGQCSATRQAAMVLTGLYERDSKRLGELGVAYEQSRHRGLTCEAAWESIRHIDAGQ